MIVRFTAQNFCYFNKATEFSLIPKTEINFPYHRISNNGISSLRFGALMGINESGKLDLFNGIKLLSIIIKNGTITNVPKKAKFVYSEEAQNKPISLSLEFFCGSHTYCYAISFDYGQVFCEYLEEVQADKRLLIFKREVLNGKCTILFSEDRNKSPKYNFLAEELAEKLLTKSDLLLSYLADNYEVEFSNAKKIKEWFISDLMFISPDIQTDGIADILYHDKQIMEFANTYLSLLDLGIVSIDVQEENVSENEEIKNFDVKRVFNWSEFLSDSDSYNEHLSDQIEKNERDSLNDNRESKIKQISVYVEDGEGRRGKFSISEMGNGVKRIFQYLQGLYNIIYNDKVLLIDYIDRSIHPVLLIAMIRNLSFSGNIKGQIIFSVNGNELLNQKDLRPDEIFFFNRTLEGETTINTLNESYYK